MLVYHCHVLLHDCLIKVLFICSLAITSILAILTMGVLSSWGPLARLLGMTGAVVESATPNILSICILLIILYPLFRRVIWHQSRRIWDGFKIWHIFWNLLSLLGDIPFLLGASCKRLNLHLAVYVVHESLLRHVLIVHELASHSWWLLHIATRPNLFDGLLLLELVHLVDQHHIFHICHLVGLLLHPLLLLWFLLFMDALIVDLFLWGWASRPTRATALDFVDIYGQGLIHPLLVLVLGYRHLGLHMLCGECALSWFVHLIPPQRGVLTVFVLSLSRTLGRCHHYLTLGLLLGIVTKEAMVTLSAENDAIRINGLVMLNRLSCQNHVYLFHVRWW